MFEFTQQVIHIPKNRKTDEFVKYFFRCLSNGFFLHSGGSGGTLHSYNTDSRIVI